MKQQRQQVGDLLARRPRRIGRHYRLPAILNSVRKRLEKN